MVTFPDGARVVLGSEGGRPIHRGTVAVRGPCAPSREALMGSGLTEPQSRALEFVLAWFGHPFDSVTSEPPSGGAPRWGAWPLSGPTLIAALAHWKQHEPEAFDACLGRLGFDATAQFAEDPRLIAALARAGRERGAQRAQLETLVTHVLRPMLDSCAQAETAVDAPGGLFASARALALLFHSELRFGHGGVTRLVTLARERPEPPAAGEHLAEDLRASGRSREASEVWRILTSPELADPA
ncbi:hypothetical protein JYJ93_08210 [Corallococcus sp. NCSPR001]|nr:hypothetical protein [Corallococcus sp. NCSPR001]